MGSTDGKVYSWDPATGALLWSTPLDSIVVGSPVIATAIGAPPETVLAQPAVAADATTGWLVPPGDAGALAERLAGALALTEAERWAIAQRARAHVLAQFTVESMQLRTLAVYDRLLGTVLERRFREAPNPPAVDVSPRKS